MVAQGQTRLAFWLSQEKTTCPSIPSNMSNNVKLHRILILTYTDITQSFYCFFLLTSDWFKQKTSELPFYLVMDIRAHFKFKLDTSILSNSSSWIWHWMSWTELMCQWSLTFYAAELELTFMCTRLKSSTIWNYVIHSCNVLPWHCLLIMITSKNTFCELSVLIWFRTLIIHAKIWACIEFIRIKEL